LIKRQEFRWGTLSGLEGLDNRPLSRIGGKLADASAALTNAVASIETPVASMQKWAHALEYVRRASGDLDRHESMIDSFCRLENTKLLWLLVKNRFDQIAAANAALEISSRRRITDEEAVAARNAWTQEIRDAYGGREFEIVG
jgi:hypothetical protein